VDEHVKEVNAEQQEMVASVNNDFQLMSRVLNDVLSLDKIRLGMLEPSIEPFRLDQTVTLAVNGFRSQAHALGLQLQLEADPKISELVLLGDAGRIQQLVGNLIGNSLKFTRQGGVTIVTRLLGIAGRNASMSMATTPTGPDGITPMVLPVEELNGPGSLRDVSSKGPSSSPTASSISSCHSQSRRSSVRPARNRAIVRFEIRDTGVGFSSQDVDENRLFSEYRQTKIGQKQGASGSGLGLALCRKFIEVFGGRLGVDSEPGKGSTFWWVLVMIHGAATRVADRTRLRFMQVRDSFPDS
jgi:signal transduction histidine kinase